MAHKIVKSISNKESILKMDLKLKIWIKFHFKVLFKRNNDHNKNKLYESYLNDKMDKKLEFN